MLALQERPTSPCTRSPSRPVHHQLPGSPGRTLSGRFDTKTPPRQVENASTPLVRRILRAYSRRVGDGDVEALTLMLAWPRRLTSAIAEAVKGLRAHGSS